MLRAALKLRWGSGAWGPIVAPHTMLRAALKQYGPTMSHNLRGCTTYNAACGIETAFPLAPSFSQSRCTTYHAACGIETSPSPKIGGGRRSCTTYNAACGIETSAHVVIGDKNVVAPHTMLRAALKPFLRERFCQTWWVAPHIMLRAALKPSLSSHLYERKKLHHPQSRVRHERPYRLAALATY